MLLQHFLGELHADVRLELVVAVDDFGFQPADLAAEVLQRHLDRVLHVLADDRRRAAQRGDEADLQLLLLRQDRCGQGERGRRNDRRDRMQYPDHSCLLLL
jgi:hypothetical protein